MRGTLWCAVVLTAGLAAGCGTAVQQGTRLAAGGNYDQAVWKYVEAMDEQPDSAAAREGMAMAKKHASAQHYETAMNYIANNDYHMAAPELLRALHFDPDSDPAREALIAVHRKLGLLADAQP
jgi:Flp pilus assembly protein TadD